MTFFVFNIKNRFCDITHYEIFSPDEMMTPIKKMADRDAIDPRESDILLPVSI